MQVRSNLLGLDVGDRRVGMAVVADDVMVPRALPTLLRDEHLLTAIQQIIQERAIDRIVVGLPRNMSGEETWQTTAVRDFAKKLTAMNKPIDFQDEALTSVHAETLLRNSGKQFEKGDIDSLAALTILADYLTEAGVQ